LKERQECIVKAPHKSMSVYLHVTTPTHKAAEFQTWGSPLARSSSTQLVIISEVMFIWASISTISFGFNLKAKSYKSPTIKLH